MVNVKTISLRPTLRTSEKTTIKELIRELENYTREVETKVKLLDKAILELQEQNGSTN